MCKLLGFSVKTKLTQEKLNEVIKTSKELLKDQKDGFGYALSGGDIEGITSLRLTNGSLLGYGYDEPEEWADITRQPYKAKGKLAPCTAGIFHGRTSTNSVSIQNTHPFVNDDLALVHNGIVTYTGKTRKKKGTCDSEDIFNSFTMGGGWKELKKYYSGYAGLLLLRPDGVITIYKDETPSLYVCKIAEGFVVGTSSFDTTSLAKLLDDAPNAPWMLKPNIATTCKDGKILSKKKVEPMERRSYKQDQLSLGYSTDYGTGYGGYKYKSDYDKKDATKESFPDYKDEAGESGIRFDDPEYNDAFNSGYEDALAEIPRCPAGSTEKYKAGYEEGYQDGERDLTSGAVIEPDEDEANENEITELA
jgi:hypothetical protein